MTSPNVQPDLTGAITEALRASELVCTGLGELTCGIDAAWHSWSRHRAHVAEAVAVAVRPFLADLREQIAQQIESDETEGDPYVEFCHDFQIGWDRAQEHAARVARDGGNR